MNAAAAGGQAPQVNAALVERVRESVSARVKKLPAWIHEPLIMACARCAAAELESIAARYKKSPDALPSVLAASAMLEANSLAGYICSMPWHSLRTAEDEQRIAAAAQGRGDVSRAIADVFNSFELANVWAPAQAKEGKSAYIARVQEALPKIRFENLVLDASVLDADAERLAFAAEAGISPFYVLQADPSQALELTVLKSRRVDLSRLKPGTERELKAEPPPAAIKNRIASMRQVAPRRPAP